MKLISNISKRYHSNGTFDHIKEVTYFKSGCAGMEVKKVTRLADRSIYFFRKRIVLVSSIRPFRNN